MVFLKILKSKGFKFVILISSLTLLFQNCANDQFASLSSSASDTSDEIDFPSSSLINFSKARKASGSSTGTKSKTVFETGQIVGFKMAFSPMINSVTGSVFDHVGIIVMNGNVPYLYESMPSVGWNKRELNELNQSDFGSIAAILKLRSPLSEAEKNRLVQVLDTLVSRGSGMYHHDYLSESADDLNYGNPTSTKNDNKPKGCSEFVRYAFFRAGIPAGNPGLGKVQKVSSMANMSSSATLDSNIIAERLFLSHLRSFGLPEHKNYWAVSPDAIMNDSRLTMVASKIAFGGRYFSEKEALASFTGFEMASATPRQPYPSDWNQQAYSPTIGGTNPSTPTIPSDPTTPTTPPPVVIAPIIVPPVVDLKPVCDFQVLQQSSQVSLKWTCTNATALLASCSESSSNTRLTDFNIPAKGDALLPNGYTCIITAANFSGTGVKTQYLINLNAGSVGVSVYIPTNTNIYCKIPPNFSVKCTDNKTYQSGDSVSALSSCQALTAPNVQYVGHVFNCGLDGAWH